MALRDFEVDFSGLTKIPGLIKKTREDDEIKRTLADLDSSDPRSLRAKGTQLFRTGTERGMEIGLRLHQTALAREQLAQRASEAGTYAANLPAILGGARSGSATPEGGGGVTFNPPFGGGAEGPAQMPGLRPWPEAPRPQSAAPGADMSAQARRPQGTPVEPGQWTPAPGMASPTLPAPDLQSQAPTLNIPGGGPGSIPQQQRRAPPTVPGDQGSEERLSAIVQELARTPKGQVGRREALRQMYSAEIGRTSWGPKVKEWQMDRMDRYIRGEDDISYGNWRREEEVAKDAYKDSLDAYKDYDKGKTKAESVLGTLEVMEEIRVNPEFAAGPGAPLWAAGVSLVAGVRDALKTMGVPESALPDMSRVTNQAALIQAFDGLSNRLTFDTLGSVGNQVSNTDRIFVSAMMPTLRQTKEGQAILIELASAIAKRSVDSGKAVDAYMQKVGARASRAGINKAIADDAESNSFIYKSDRSLTSLGEKIKRVVAGEPNALGGAIKRVVEPTPGPTGAATSPRTPGPPTLREIGGALSSAVEGEGPLAGAPPTSRVPTLRDIGRRIMGTPEEASGEASPEAGGPPTLRDIGRGIMGAITPPASGSGRLSARPGTIVYDRRGRPHVVGPDGVPVLLETER